MSTQHAAEKVILAWAEKPGRAVILDFNGTLSDDEPILQQIFTEIFLERFHWRLTPKYYDEHLLGHSDREIIETVVTDRGGASEALIEELLGVRRRRYQEIVAGRSPVSQAATALVRRLRRACVPIAIVTGAEREEVRAVLDGCLVGQFVDVVVTAEDVTCGKPDPEGFLKGAALLGCHPQNVLVFEDSLPGVMAAGRAGMTCILVADRPRSPELAARANAVVPRLTDDLLAHVKL
jgi:beta-phosphoglucomutase